MNKIPIFLILFFGGINTGAQTQNLNFHHLTTKDGLTHNKIVSLFQDSDGFLWLTTTDGLNRYDGKSFKTYFHSDKDSNSVCSDNLNNIIENKNKCILISGSEGISEFNKCRNSFRTVFVPNDKGNNIKNTGISRMFFDKKGYLWAFSQTTLYELDSTYKIIKSYKDEIAGVNQIYDAVQDKSGNIWISKQQTLNLLDFRRGVIYNRFNNPENKDIFKTNITGFRADTSGNLWLLTVDHFLKKYNSKGNETFKIKVDSTLFLENIFIIDNGKLWINTQRKGVYLFNQSSNTFTHYYNEVNNQQSICDDMVNDITKDNNKNVWVATTNGLDFIPAVPTKLSLLNNFGYDRYLKSQKIEISNFIKEDDNLWIASWGRGLYHINTKKDINEHFICGKADLDNWIWDIILFKNEIWFGNFKGLHKYNYTNHFFTDFESFFSYPLKGRDTAVAFGFFKDKEHNIWTALGKDGIARYDSANNKFLHFTKGDCNIPFTSYDAIAQDEHGVIWMGNNHYKGITTWNDKEQKFITPLKSGVPVFNDYVNCLITDKNNIWIGTNGGLYKLNTQKNYELVKFDRSNGLINDNINTMAKDANKNLWIGTDNGISEFNTETSSFVNTGIEMELHENEIRNSFFDSTTGGLYFSTPHTIFSFCEDSMNVIKTILLPVITSFKVMGIERPLYLSETQELNYSDKYFSFEFTAPYFPSSVKNVYAYRLDGFDTGWINIGNRQLATYTNLSDGNYTFRLKASTDGIEWVEMKNPIAIHINAPFYKTTLFYLLIAATCIMVIFLIVYSAYRSKLKRILIAQKIRNNIASDLHDDIGSSLSSIMIMSELAKNRQEETGNYFDKIKENAGTIIENMNDIVWAVNPGNDTIEQLFTRMQSYASSLLEKKDIKFQFVTQSSLASVKLDMEERKNFYLIFKEAIHNAFKYSCCNEVTAEIHQQGNAIIMTIHDNGKGFDSIKKYTGNGLTNMKKRTEQINGRLEITSDYGTSLILAFKPIQKSS